MMENKSDESLIKSTAEGCSDSLRELTSRYGGAYYKIRSSYEGMIRNTLFDSDYFLSYPEILIYKAAKSYKINKGASFLTWLTYIVKGHFLDSLKRKKNKSIFNCDIETKESERQSSFCFFDKVKQCLEPNLYQTISYRYEYGYTPKEVAKKMNCHYETFRHRHNKALGILRDSLSQDCLNFL